MVLLVMAAWAAYVFFAVQVIFHGLRIASFLVTALILCLLFLFLVFWSLRALTKPPENNHLREILAPAPPEGPAASGSGAGTVRQPSGGSAGSGSIRQLTFRVAGTTFRNEDGSDRQEILRHLHFADPPFADDPDDLLAEIEETEYNNELAYAVLINGYQVGFVPRAKVANIQRALSTFTWTVDDVQIAGGGTDASGEPIPWGCKITGSYIM